ncbi:hypothetical protein NQ318_023374 [Aromia moschata]|uniref:Large ribosomal subunit protein eL14 n=1 Tax=Aromia moschata TaxID=1265417 RepID=A0AAV8X2H9_9CUCU|nr:hypothetical protein NQ318_023374 [Aromia moschata]
MVFFIFQPFRRFVETGRVAVVSDGPNKGKLVSIIDVIDQTRRLLHVYVRKAWSDAKVDEQWTESVWAKKRAAKDKRAQLTDFDRFKLRRVRSRRNHIRTATFLALRKAASRNGTLYGKKTMAKGGDKPKPSKKAKPEKKTAPKKK